MLDEEGAETEPLDPQTFATRYRSMMRYCFANANSIGFVVSQDGEVRAMTRVKDTMLFWPNVTLEGDAMSEYHVHCSDCSALGNLFLCPTMLFEPRLSLLLPTSIVGSPEIQGQRALAG